MRIVLTLALAATVTGAFAAAPSAPSVFVPPAPKAAVDAELYPLAPELVAAYLAELAHVQTFWDFHGKNAQLQAEAQGDPSLKVLKIGRGIYADLGPEDLFQPPVSDGQYQVFLGAVTSADAVAIRVQVDLSALADDEELWVIDPVGQRPFGPYTRADHVADGRWLPTLDGDTAVLMVRSLRADLPQVRLVRLSHFFRSPIESKALSCNINIACESNSTIRQISTGVGMIVVPTVAGDAGLCSGTLINNPSTADLEPYYITANHCVPEAASVNQVDILWDYRASSCSSDDPPELSELLRSSGESVLVTDSSLDCTLMRLDEVPVGPLGRSFVGWDASLPAYKEEGVVLHFPDATHMRISYARVLRTNVSTITLGYTHQNEVQYPSGVTEGGSSGSCLLSEAHGYQLIGTLSNGPSHSCGTDRSGNTDRFSSLRHFYYDTAAKNYLGGNSSGDECPSAQTLKDNPEALKTLRNARDRALTSGAPGAQLVKAYYLAAPTLTRIIRQSEEARAAFAAVASGCAKVAGILMR